MVHLHLVVLCHCEVSESTSVLQIRAYVLTAYSDGVECDLL